MAYYDCLAQDNQARHQAQDRLALFTHFLPVELLGFDEEFRLETPPVDLMYALLSVDGFIDEVSLETRSHGDLSRLLSDTGWGEGERAMAWIRLENIEHNPVAWPEPLHHLPAIARWCCEQSGNAILDRYYDSYGLGPDHDCDWFTWADLTLLRQLWQQAKPVAHVFFHRLLPWYRDQPQNLAKLAGFLVTGEGAQALDW